MNTSHFNNSRIKRFRTSGIFDDDNNIEAQLEACKVENAKLKDIVAKQTILIDDLQNQRANEEMVAEIEILKENEAEIQAELDLTQTEMVEEQHRLQNEIDKLEWMIKDQAAEARQQVEYRDNEIKELKEQLEQAKDVKFFTNNEEIENIKKVFGSQIGRLNAQIKYLTDNNNELELARQNVQQEMKDNYNMVIDTINTDRQKAIEASEGYKEEIKALEDQLKASKDEIEKRGNELKQKEDDARTVIEDQQKKIQILEEQLRQAKVQLENARKETAVTVPSQLQTTSTDDSAFACSSSSETQISAADDSVVQDIIPQLEKVKKDVEIKYFSVNEIHDGSEILYDRLGKDFGTRVVVNVQTLEADRSTFWKLYSSDTSKPVEMDVSKVFKRTRFEFNLTEKFICNVRQNNHKIQEIIHRINQSFVIDLTIEYQTFDRFDFKKLVQGGTVKMVKFRENTIKKSNGNIMRLDEILGHLTNVEHFHYYFKSINELNANTAKYLSKLSRFEKLKHFELYNCANTFDLGNFNEFMKKHENVTFILHFRSYISTVENKIKQNADALAVPPTCKFKYFF